jgi:hypothetical protein
MTTVPCGACRRANLIERRYCGGCGGNLAPICRGCGFANQGDDRFCGGCGDPLTVEASTRSAHPAPAWSSTAAVVEQSAGASDLDLNELFRASSETTGELPRIGINQADLDRMFGASS